jgi:hypothetical protein
MKKPAIMLILCLSLVGFLFSGSDYKMVKNFNLSPGSAYTGSILSWGGTINIDGSLKGSVILFGGGCVLSGQVEEDVICLDSKVDIRESAVIKGDLFVIGGTVSRDPHSIVNGESFISQLDLKKLEAAVLPLFSDSQTIAFIKAVMIILWLIIALIVFAVIPGKVIHAGEMLEKNLLKTGTIGILSLISFLFLLLMFVVLSFFIIGIPLFFLLLFAYFIVYIFGRTVIFYFVGIKLSGLLKLKRVTPAFFIVFGALFYVLLKFLPYVGPVALFILNLFELGIGIVFIFKKKLRLEV